MVQIFLCTFRSIDFFCVLFILLFFDYVMEPGDFILVPSNSSHQVFNIHIIHGGVAMAGNFIDDQCQM